MRDYHHTVIDKATPFGDFTNWCKAVQLSGVNIKQTRIARLKALLDAKFDGNQSAMASAARKRSTKTRNPSFFNGLLSGKKSFGEKLARTLEIELQLESKALDQPIDDDKSNIIPAPAAEYPYPISIQEFRALKDDQQNAILSVMQAFAPTKEQRAARRKKSAD